MCFHAGSGISLRSLQPTWPNKMDAEAAIPWSSLAQLSTLRLSDCGIETFVGTGDLVSCQIVI